MSYATETPIPPAALTVDDLCEHLTAQRPADAALLCEFARRFFAKAPRPLLLERDVDALAAMVTGAYDFLLASRPELVNVEVKNPEEEGWSAPVTLLRAQVGDRPFIVDTIREYLAAEELTIASFVYPVLRVERSAEGEVVELGAPTGGELEVLVHCEIERVDDAARRAEIAREVERRLGDVVRATSDYGAMQAALERAVAWLRQHPEQLAESAQEHEEGIRFLEWLRQGSFVFLGYREYALQGEGEHAAVQVIAGSGLGILRDERASGWAAPTEVKTLPEPLRRRVAGGPTLVITKTNRESTVHRRARMDYVGVREVDAQGHVLYERRFLGLFTSKAFHEPAEDIPILRRKLQHVLKASGAPAGSHDYKEIVSIFNSWPKEDLFQASERELEHDVRTVLALLFADDVHVAMRPDPLGRGVSAMVILPRGTYSGEVRQQIHHLLERRLQGTVLNYHLALGAGEQARLHFFVAAPEEAAAGTSAGELEAEVREVIRSWPERFAEALAAAHPAAEAQRLAALYADAFNDEYRAITTPATAVHDVAVLERMQREQEAVAIELRPQVPGPDLPPNVNLLELYLRDERLVLSDFLPLLENAGIRVVDVNPSVVSGPGVPHVTVYSFAVQTREGQPLPLERADPLAEMLLAVRAGLARNDGFNALVLKAGLRWREADVLRTYAHYAFQVGAIPTRSAGAWALAAYPEVAKLLLELFRARFDPALGGERAVAVAEVRSRIGQAMEQVTALADDRALRKLWAFIDGTVRTNYWRRGAADPSATSGGAPYLSLKVRSADVEELKKTRLLYEVFVHSAHMEGIHLRAAPVSRGGIRWSDRPDDFRTEIMGLVQTQVVKNTVIVPSGSKGGFITRRRQAEREAMLHEAAEQYRTLMRGLLDLTDNLMDGQVVPPPEVVRHDGDDPYLVVAADKGTAHLSDTANAVSAEYGFWLGDAFASGGSHGYDHKEEGITARGAWECVKRHFRELGKDIQAEPFTVAGIGDLSGDVFGNGMLLSRQIRLVAAFDHRHIFLDPTPDPETSYRERERIFALPRSSWEDYDPRLLSPGGFIVPRGSKSVQITPEARAALGLDETVTVLDGEALIRAVLRAPVELLWNGGIGTYVKAADETHAEAGDPSNDPVRVNADELRCRVVGEGGNLGFTQNARIAFALAGGRLNTDALDNSGGVDMSDHEVNLKILLGAQVAEGAMSFAQRNELLASMTDEVSALVLRNNRNQSLAVSLDEQRSREALRDFAALISALEKEGLLDRRAADVPSSDTLAERAAAGLGLTRPTLCVLLAYAKMQAKQKLLASALPDDAATQPYLAGYFPSAAVAATGQARLQRHRLRREIITTELTSDLIDLMGSSFLHRVARDSGRELAEVVRAWLIASRIAGATELRADLQRAEGEYSAAVVYRWLSGLARVLEATTHWVLENVPADAHAAAVIQELRDGLAQLRGSFAEIVVGEDRTLFRSRVQEMAATGVETALAERILTLRFLSRMLDILRVVEGGDPVATARTYYQVDEYFGFARLRSALAGAGQAGGWEKRFAQALLDDVDAAQRAVTRKVLASAAAGDARTGLDVFVAAHARAVAAYRALLEQLTTEGAAAPLAAYALAVRALREAAE
mgnify:CR=1 FL=1